MAYELLSKIFYKDQKNYEERYRQRFESELSMRLPIFIHDNQAFFTTPIEIINTIEKIFKMNSHIDVMASQLPSIAIRSLISKSLNDEITLTNDIEGISSTRKEIEEAVLSQNNNKKARFKGLAAKYIKLIKDNQIQLTICEDIRKIYDDIVLDEIDDKNKPDGKIFRKEPVHVVSATQKEKHRGIMPEEKIIEYMEYCLDFIQNKDINMLIKAAVFHYLFGYIHPFYDGNGRTSRFISSCLLKDELGILVSLRLSYVIKNNLKVYYEAFDICNDFRNKGEITYFIIMFLHLLEEAATDLYHKLADLSDKLVFYQEILSAMGMKKKKENLLFILCQNSLFGDMYITFDELVDNLKLSATSTRELIKELDEDGYLKKEKYGKKIGYTANLIKIDEFYTQ